MWHKNEKTMADILSKGLLHNPNNIALESHQTSISYKELDEFSTRFSIYLIRAGVRKGDKIIISSKKSYSTIAAIIGILKCGCVFIPIDPDSPINRTRYIIEDTNPKVIIMPNEYSIKDSKNTIVLSFEEVENILNDDLNMQNVEFPYVCGDDAAYCMYTSGSTGQPKGVLIKHNSVVSFFNSIYEFIELDQNSKSISLNPIFADASIVDLFYPLYQGAYVYLYDQKIIPKNIWRVIQDKGINYCDVVSSLLTLLVESVELTKFNLSKLKIVSNGAEILNVNTAQKLLRQVPGLLIVNAYGPTEATCICVVECIREIESDRQETYPIGKPLKGIKAIIVDDENNEINELNVFGELLVSGTQVMSGYLNKPSETNKRMYMYKGDYYYRTGDICFYDNEKKINIVGRIDEDIKVSGYRVNLNEIREAVHKLPYIKSFVVLSVQERVKGKVPALAVILQRGADNITEDKIKNDLKDDLPKFMIPRYVLLCNQFPTVPSGKVDLQRIKLLINLEFNIT
ncbi:amino acid adenylation domain-containing protein [Paenibacillus gansuensis]|uniref:Amino acid adenylation domain-containing protein n=1 Tax=Paenibacillus gansuensis TaxID=306542 RepID=A0ABW5PHE4_9BACL